MRRVLFAWLIADGDMHLKNLALLKSAEPGSRQFATVRFAPLYDAVTTRIFPGLAGDRGGDLAGAAPSGAQRSDLQAGQFAKRASFTRSVKETGPAVPGRGKGPPRASAGTAGLAVLRQGWKPVRGETRSAATGLDAKHDSPTPRSGGVPTRDEALTFKP